MTVTTPSAAAPSSWSWLLIVSLALNLLVVGAVGGAVLSHNLHGGPWPGPAPKLFDQINFGKTIGGENGLRAFVQMLPPERRAALKPLLDEAHQTIKPLRDKAQALRDAAHGAFILEPYDAAKAEKAANDLFEAETATRRTVVQYFSRLLALLTPGERSQFFAWRKALGPPPPPGDQPPGPPAGVSPK